MGTSIRKALESAAPGTAIVYHTGAKLADCPVLKDVRRLYDEGRAELVQRRVPEGFDYIVQIRRNPVKVLNLWRFADAGLA